MHTPFKTTSRARLRKYTRDYRNRTKRRRAKITQRDTKTKSNHFRQSK